MSDAYTPPTDPVIGMLLDGRYRVDARIARGGMATVYRATDERLDRTVAVKVLHLHLAEDAAFRARFAREARAAARLSHPNVVGVHDQGKQDGFCYLVLEHVPGHTLRELLTDQGRLAPQVALEVLDQVLQGLAAAHRAGIIHRDLKPENVLITPSGRVCLADFGLARAATASTSASSALIGTVAYLSPELLRRGDADARSDVYAVGVMLYEMLTGRQPFPASAPATAALRQATEQVPVPSEIVPDIPVELDDLVVWATRLDPQDRPHDADDLLEETRRVQRELGLPAGTHEALAELLEHADHGDRSVSATEVLTPTLVASDAVPATTAEAGAAPPEAPTSATGSTPTTTPGTALLAIAPAEDAAAAPDAVAADADDALDRVRERAAARRRRGGLMTLVVVLVTALLAAAGWFLGDGPGMRLTVPDVAGQTPEAAETALDQLGLAHERAEEHSLDVPTGQVIRTDPEAGSRVPRDATVTVVVSLGPRMIALPDVTDSDADAAAGALAQAGFVVADARTEHFDADVTKGRVIGVAGPDGGVTAGTQIAERTTLTLVVSLGAVPDVTGATLDDATGLLQAVGLSIQSSEAYDDDVPAGKIISQRATTDPVSAGDPIAVVVSKGPEMVTVPDVSGKTLNEARDALRAAGLDGTSSIPDQSIPVFGGRYWDQIKVSGTNPAAGSQVRKGASVAMQTIGTLLD